MKSKEFSKKLNLNKKTISKLSEDVKNKVYGGGQPPRTDDFESRWYCCPMPADTSPLGTCP
jgi:hypothetical protein